MTLFGYIGGAAGDFFTKTPANLAGAVSFSIVALIFLITQEWLPSASRLTGHQALWYVNIWLFVGMYLMIAVDRATESEEEDEGEKTEK